MVSLVSIAEIKGYINVGSLEDAELAAMDSKLQQIGQLSTKLLQNFCRHEFQAQELTQFYSTRSNAQYSLDITGDASNVSGLNVSAKQQGFTLKGYPVDINSLEVYYDPARQYTADTLLTVGTDYVVDDDTQRLYIVRPVAATFRGIKAVYTAGYALGDIPDDPEDEDLSQVIVGAPEDLRQACLIQCVYLWNKLKEANIGLSRDGDNTPQYEINGHLLCSEAKAIAAPYRALLMGKY